MTRRLLALALLALLGAAPPPSVLVTTATPRQGAIPQILTAYGTITPSPGGSQTLSLLHSGQVTRLLVTPGQPVHAGQPLLTITADPATLAAYQQATAALALARGNRARTAQALAAHLATRAQLAQADAAVATALTTLDALQREGGTAPEQTLAAPFDGMVTALAAEEGGRIAAQTPLVTIARTDRLMALVGVEPSAQRLLAPGQPAQIASLEATGALVPGQVRSVGAMFDPATRLIPVTITASPPDPPASPATDPPPLLAGESVRVSVQIGTLRGWLIPRDAVLTDSHGPYLFQANGNHAVRIPVSIVGAAGPTTVVAGPLDPARPLITSGGYQLDDAALIRTAASP